MGNILDQNLHTVQLYQFTVVKLATKPFFWQALVNLLVNTHLKVSCLKSSLTYCKDHKNKQWQKFKFMKEIEKIGLPKNWPKTRRESLNWLKLGPLLTKTFWSYPSFLKVWICVFGRLRSRTTWNVSLLGCDWINWLKLHIQWLNEHFLLVKMLKSWDISLLLSSALCNEKLGIETEILQLSGLP